MDLLIWWFKHFIDFGIASIPLVTYFLCKKQLKLRPKSTLSIIVLQLAVSIYFWVEIKDIFMILYQSVPYISSFICLWCDRIMLKGEAG